MSAPDPFALGGRQDDDDAEMLSLFRQWIEGHRAAERMDKSIEAEDAYDAAIDRICDIEHEIADIPASGPVGFAVKAYLACYFEHLPRSGDDPAGVSLISRDCVIEPGAILDDFVSFHCIAAVIRDAARFVPEIAELGRLVIDPPPDRVAAEAMRTRARILGVPETLQ
jgi:hypothetical protein